MKKVVTLLLFVAILAFPMSTYAASKPMTEKEILVEIDKQQKIYDEDTKLAAEYLTTLVESKTMTFQEKIELQKTLDATRKIYLDAAKSMDKLRIALFELKKKYDF